MNSAVLSLQFLRGDPHDLHFRPESLPVNRLDRLIHLAIQPANRRHQKTAANVDAIDVVD
jgi:hypothetical protein